MRVVRSMCAAAEETEGCKVGFPEFEELRAKTDRQLIRIIESDLELGIRVARQALNSAGACTPTAEQSYSRAELAHNEVSRLLPIMYEVAGRRSRQMGSEARTSRRIAQSTSGHLFERQPKDRNDPAKANPKTKEKRLRTY